MKLERPLEPERPVEIANVEDFDRECTQIEAAARRDGRLYGLTLSSDQALLTIVVGGEVSMVEWMGLGTDGVMREVKHARSTVQIAGEVDFIGGGQESGIMPYWAMDPAVAKAAAREFVEAGGKLPTNVEWLTLDEERELDRADMDRRRGQ